MTKESRQREEAPENDENASCRSSYLAESEKLKVLSCIYATLTNPEIRTSLLEMDLTGKGESGCTFPMEFL